MKKEDLKKLSDPSFHKEIGIMTKWRIGDKSGAGQNVIYPYYDADQCREILDQVCGIDGWSNEYREVSGYLFAVIGIWMDEKVIEKSDAGGSRSNTRTLGDDDKETFKAKTAASSAFVRTATAWGIGRHHSLLPKMILKTAGAIAYTPEGAELNGPEQLSAYCNATSTAAGYLYWIYNIERAKFDDNERGTALLTELKNYLNGNV